MPVFPAPTALDPTADGAAPALARDRVDDWLEELQRVALAAAALSPGARDRVVAVIDACESEDGWLPPLAAEARLLLAEAAGPGSGAKTRVGRAAVLVGTLGSRLHPLTTRRALKVA